MAGAEEQTTKAHAYDALAELAISAATKIAHADDDDAVAILRRYLNDSLGVMRRTGALCKALAPSQSEPMQPRLGRRLPAAPQRAPETFGRASIAERLAVRRTG